MKRSHKDTLEKIILSGKPCGKRMEERRIVQTGKNLLINKQVYCLVIHRRMWMNNEIVSKQQSGGDRTGWHNAG